MGCDYETFNVIISTPIDLATRPACWTFGFPRWCPIAVQAKASARTN